MYPIEFVKEAEAIRPRLAKVCGKEICAKCGKGKQAGAFFTVGYGRKESGFEAGAFFTRHYLAGECPVYLCDVCVGNEIPVGLSSAEALGCFVGLVGAVVIALLLGLAFAPENVRPPLPQATLIASAAIVAALLIGGLPEVVWVS